MSLLNRPGKAFRLHRHAAEVDLEHPVSCGAEEAFLRLCDAATGVHGGGGDAIGDAGDGAEGIPKTPPGKGR
ncbi:MAG TPA: hypothetical protein PLQ95_03160 [Thiobacillus sp.]|nr:hypothetical protein [Thiobacillus sp.]